MRLRVIFLCSLLFLAAGAGLLAITYLLMRSPNGEIGCHTHWHWRRSS